MKKIIVGFGIILTIVVLISLVVIRGVKEAVDNKTFVVLLQNTNEIRPSGGFMGSYLRIKLQESRIKEMMVEDIYVPDGQLDGHVEPPYPIQEAFGQGWWKLRDANWDIDFASASGAVAWFMKEGGEGEVDGIVAINDKLIKKILGIVGGVKPKTYDETVTEKNLDTLAQRYAQVDFQPGSTSKRDFLGAVSEALKTKLKEPDIFKWIQIAKLVYVELQRGEILVWFKDDKWQQKMDYLGWTGRVVPKAGQGFLYIVESNLGSNKANCCISKNVIQAINGDESTIKVEWQNDNPFQTPKPPIFWGGEYLNYLRIVIPARHNVKAVKVQERELRLATTDDFDSPNSLRRGIAEDIYSVEPRGQLQIIGFWVKVEADNSATAELKFQIPSSKSQKLLVKRQPGEKEWKYKLIIDGKLNTEQVVNKDLVISGYGE